jgi:hypothetical protein
MDTNETNPNNNAQPTQPPAPLTPQPVAKPVMTIVPNHMVMAVISLFFFWPLSIPAIINANKVNMLLMQNDVEGARTASKRAKKWSLWAYGVTIFAIVLGIIAAIVVAMTSFTAPLKVSDEMLADIRKGDSTAGYALTTSNFKDEMSISEFETAVEKSKSLPLDTAKVTSEHLSADSSSDPMATFEYSLTQDGKKYSVKIQLVSTDDKWAVQALEIKPA